MITPEKLAGLRNVERFSKLSWVFGNDTAKELLDTIEALWKENEELKRLLAHERDEFGKKETRLLAVVRIVEESYVRSYKMEKALKSLREGKP